MALFITVTAASMLIAFLGTWYIRFAKWALFSVMCLFAVAVIAYHFAFAPDLAEAFKSDGWHVLGYAEDGTLIVAKETEENSRLLRARHVEGSLWWRFSHWGIGEGDTRDTDSGWQRFLKDTCGFSDAWASRLDIQNPPPLVLLAPPMLLLLILLPFRDVKSEKPDSSERTMG